MSGPVLFRMFINDLPSVCPEVDVLMYADDAVLIVHGQTKTEVSAILTKSTAQLTTWLNHTCFSPEQTTLSQGDNNKW